MLYTDGACRNNGYPDARAAWGFHSRYVEGSGLVPESEPQTSVRAELTAILKGLEALRDTFQRKRQTWPVEVMTDSEYAVNSMNKWILGWRQNGWVTSRGGRVAHKGLLQNIDNLSRSPEFEDDVVFTHVRGHAGIPGNERADKLAKDELKYV